MTASKPPARCVPCEKGAVKMNLERVLALLKDLEGWEVKEGPPQALSRAFRFNTFHETMAFVNAVAWIAHTQDHHPDLRVSYRACVVEYTTHAAGGLTENDFICAAHVSRLFA